MLINTCNTVARLCAVFTILLLSAGAQAKAGIASLVPAATEIIVEMGAGKHLVAVSNWDTNRAEIADLPRVGDYRTVDWEKLIELQPSAMIVQYRQDKMPPGLSERAGQLNIRLINVSFQRLEDVFTVTRQLGDALGEPALAQAAIDKTRSQLESVRSAVAGREPVTALMGRASDNLDTIGEGTFLDDVLAIAGGKNVVPGQGDNTYPTIDREMLLEYNPAVVLNLLPGASEQVLEKSRAFWASVPQVHAVRNGRVHHLVDSHLLLPGLRLGNVAEQFARLLHPDAFTVQSEGSAK